ncbi:MAG: LrgB family protein [Bacteroidales bacterium]|nr:LrgB family protein [Bacteroidales bacterium]MBQ5541329.1 LrgB family protein [Bacteroidales bacterium]MBR4678761.1 LrgB family protein [Bacteroidales bacterium]MEE3447711.1 LrgB family protein [Bacteroidales bacterium]
MEFLKNNFFLLFITFAVFYGSKKLQQKTGLIILNPILITIAVLICYLLSLDIPYEEYSEAGKMIEFWLKPAVVALGVPLYRQLSSIKKQLLPLAVSSFAGCVAGIVSVVLSAYWFGASGQVAVSMASKSVTTPIAMEITNSLGGISSLTAVVVVFTGIFGAIFGFAVLKIGGVKNPISQSFAMGMAAHAVGTSRALEVGPHFGAYSSLGLTLNGIITAVFTPVILHWMGFV